MRKTITAAAAVLVTGLIATGCALPVSPGGQAGAGSAKSLVVYSNSVSDGRGDWLKKEAEKTGFKLQLVDLGGGDIRNRLLAEKANPIADVTFGLNNVYFENLKKDDVLDSYTPSWAGEVDAKASDLDGKEFWPIVREPVMLVYNKAAYTKPGQAPSDWPDLWTKKQFAKRYEVQSTLGGATTQMVLAGILSRYRDDKGDLGVSQAGWDAVKAYFRNGVPSVADTDLYAQMASGKVDAGQMWLAGKATREQQYKIATEAVHPKIGVPVVVQQVGLVKGTKKSAEAKKFIDWFGSAKIQAAWSQQFHTAPMNKDALPQADQAAVSATDSFTEQDIDWPFVAQHLDQWVEKIELDYLAN
ncbi:extracellular solute-binding protein [Streptomyces sp. MI02-2A]|uniref:extracellular solute-binding protein n=1 Tax=Streptomyces sp. MI02-2A TaxID=3028688 RepID=UPI0029A6186A|nr:extracellular solute-binding protein [Streptomyces sp. MI02-2A]MDX3264968.1 extracellular solute-binding protein [Streptomyces sp. MI02-2A]